MRVYMPKLPITTNLGIFCLVQMKTEVNNQTNQFHLTLSTVEVSLLYIIYHCGLGAFHIKWGGGCSCHVSLNLIDVYQIYHFSYSDPMPSRFQGYYCSSSLIVWFCCWLQVSADGQSELDCVSHPVSLCWCPLHDLPCLLGPYTTRLAQIRWLPSHNLTIGCTLHNNILGSFLVFESISPCPP